MSTTMIYPSASLDPIRSFEEVFETKTDDIKSFLDFVNNCEEMFTDFNDENCEATKRMKNIKYYQIFQKQCVLS